MITVDLSNMGRQALVSHVSSSWCGMSLESHYYVYFLLRKPLEKYNYGSGKTQRIFLSYFVATLLKWKWTAVCALLFTKNMLCIVVGCRTLLQTTEPTTWLCWKAAHRCSLDVSCMVHLMSSLCLVKRSFIICVSCRLFVLLINSLLLRVASDINSTNYYYYYYYYVRLTAFLQDSLGKPAPER